MFAGMGFVAAGLLGFYYAQFSIQGKRSPTTVKNLAEIPTCKHPFHPRRSSLTLGPGQLRHAQQQPGLVPELPKDIDDNYTRYTPDFQPKPGESLPLPGRDIKARPVVSTVLSFLHVRLVSRNMQPGSG